MSKQRAKKMVLDCLLPTGLMLRVNTTSSATFDDVKRDVWQQAAKLPLFAVLKEPETYGFRYVNLEAEVVEIDDDHQAISTVTMYQPVLKMFQRKGSPEEQRWNIEIGSLISKHLNDFESMRDQEVNAFRKDILSVCQEAVKTREQDDMEALGLYRYPPNIESTPMPKGLRRKVAERGYHVKIKVLGDHPKEFIIKADIDGPTTSLIQQALRKRAGGAGKVPSDFVLKVVGRDEYLLGNHKLGNYKHVRRCLAKGHEKQDLSDIETVLILETKTEFHSKLPQHDKSRHRALMKRVPQQAEKRQLGQLDSLWYGQYAENKFEIKIVDAVNVVSGKLFGIGVCAGIYLGDVCVCRIEKTRYIPPSENPVWGQILEFDIAYKDIPRNARLCLALHGVWANPLKVKKKKNIRNEFPLAWVNVTILDFKNCLRQGQLQLATWQYPDTESDLMNPLGTTVPNAIRNQTPLLTLEFEEFPRIMKYPESDLIGHKTDGRVDANPAGETALELKEMEPVIYSDPLHKLNDREIELLRKYKYYQKHIPCALSKCLRAVDWQRNEAAHQTADMLRLWAALKPEEALDLLDAAYGDESIRSYAVQCLDTMSDEKLQTFLLQLVQVLKYEAYLNCDLARFLLRRALRNQRIGHFFFWYLKSEMHLPEVSVRFGLLLEAYCRGCGSHMTELSKQHDALRKIERVCDAIKDKSIKDKKGYAAAELEKANLGTFQLPLDPSISLKQVVVRKVFDSAQKPLWLVFKNADDAGADVNVMFKAGDDLRQDMLTLQLIRLMDQLWQENGLHLLMNAYDCLSTGDEVGLLEMVMQSATIAKIQGGVKNVIMADDTLEKWMRAKNPTPDAFMKACDAFLVSCAGYCVATYVLGVADRHNDNIMCTESGELFHIDFGHFLANWKSKFGVRRERVKFILVPEFVLAMTAGEGQKSDRWGRFKDVCRQAYIIVRRHANLFINLLNMMLSTGIPELRSHEDVKYLRETLCLDMASEDEAADNFMDEIDTALRDSKTVKVNWAFHSARHG